LVVATHLGRTSARVLQATRCPTTDAPVWTLMSARPDATPVHRNVSTLVAATSVFVMMATGNRTTSASILTSVKRRAVGASRLVHARMCLASTGVHVLEATVLTQTAQRVVMLTSALMTRCVSMAASTCQEDTAVNVLLASHNTTTGTSALMKMSVSNRTFVAKHHASILSVAISASVQEAHCMMPRPWPVLVLVVTVVVELSVVLVAHQHKQDPCVAVLMAFNE
jgi:hypothetical protein